MMLVAYSIVHILVNRSKCKLYTICSISFLRIYMLSKYIYFGQDWIGAEKVVDWGG
jgi:hypothetical protein